MSNAIASSDPQAVELLVKRIAELEARQQRMREVNKLVRKHDTAGLLALGYSQAETDGFFKPDFCERLGFPDYELTNNNGNIRRLKQRLANVQAESVHREEAEPVEEAGEGWTYREDLDENRAMFTFPGKPEAKVRDILKAKGFKWSPTRTAWVRLLNENARWAAGRVIEQMTTPPHTCPTPNSAPSGAEQPVDILENMGSYAD